MRHSQEQAERIPDESSVPFAPCTERIVRQLESDQRVSGNCPSPACSVPMRMDIRNIIFQEGVSGMYLVQRD